MPALWVTPPVSVSLSQSTFYVRFLITCVLMTVQLTFATKTLPVIIVMTVHLLTNQYLSDNLPKMQIRINIGLLSFSYYIFREGNLQHLCNRTCVINHCRQDTFTIHLLISKPFTVYLPTCSKF